MSTLPSEEGIVESALIQAGVIEVQAANSIFLPLLFPCQIPSTKPLWKSGPCDRGVVEEKSWGSIVGGAVVVRVGPCEGGIVEEEPWEKTL